ncbi:class I SAM-dependent methyltransferase [Nonomuraea purpurea]|uniref:Class I SAM-dependent methyltransferase n=1 Tax=Nonomuraea purpurea TaxID=1849276 RepID=A0ABV8GS91_9ACTN
MTKDRTRLATTPARPTPESCPCGDDVAVARCRVCGGSGMTSVLCLGRLPLANEFLPSHLAPSGRYPLHVLYCDDCCLAQLATSVPPEQLFTEYAYFSSASQPVLTHGTELRRFVEKELRPTREGLIVEIGSNDGYLLKEYASEGHRVLGIDPARNVAEFARAQGVPTLEAFFTSRLAGRIRRDHGEISVVHANNVLAHIPAVADVLSGVRTLLDGSDGAVVIEVPYVKDLVLRGLFDTIYHEHLFYYSLTALNRLIEAAGLVTVHVEHVRFHGGSLRVVARAGTPRVHRSVPEMLAAEDAAGMRAPAFYQQFGRRMTRFLTTIRQELRSIAEGSRRLAGYGAPAKASIMTGAAGIPLRYICDSTPYKQGKVLPGTRIPIVPPGHLLADQPDYCVLFAWNYADTIIAANQDYLRRGGVFIKPADYRLEYIGRS